MLQAGLQGGHGECVCDAEIERMVLAQNEIILKLHFSMNSEKFPGAFVKVKRGHSAQLLPHSHHCRSGEDDGEMAPARWPPVCSKVFCALSLQMRTARTSTTTATWWCRRACVSTATTRLPAAPPARGEPSGKPASWGADNPTPSSHHQERVTDWRLLPPEVPGRPRALITSLSPSCPQ